MTGAPASVAANCKLIAAVSSGLRLTGENWPAALWLRIAWPLAKVITSEGAGGAAGTAESIESVCADSVVIEQTITLAKKASPVKDTGNFMRPI